MTVRILSLLLACASLAPAYASALYSTDFNSDTPGLNRTPSGWLLLAGTVDILNSGEYSVPCFGGTGRCVDLDGSTGQGGTIATVATFDLHVDRTYTLTYWLAGSRWISSDTVTVSFGGAQQIHQIQNWSPQTMFTLTFRPSSELAGQRIMFSNAGGDNNGAILDQVTLTVSNPEPSAGFLMMGGLAALGFYRRRIRT